MAGEITYSSYRSQKSDSLLGGFGGMFGGPSGGGGTTPTENYVKLTGETSQSIEGEIHINSAVYATTGYFTNGISIDSGIAGDGYLGISPDTNGGVLLQSNFHPSYQVDESYLYINYSGGNIMLGQNTDAVRLYMYSSATFYNHIYTNDWVGTSQFVSGFAGSGWKLGISEGGTDCDLTVDNLWVRKTMNVYELIINQIRATNGALWVSDAIKINYVIPQSATLFTCGIDTDDGNIIQPFAVNDLIRCQKWTGRGIKYYTARVTLIDAGGGYFEALRIDGTDIPEPNDDVVRIGNTTNTNRQGALYLTSNDSGAPYMDILDGVTTASFAGCTKVRLGKLTGITDADFGGALSGYGLYSNNVYLKGSIQITSGTIGSNVSVNANAAGITSPDVRSTNEPPSYYYSKGRGTYSEFKERTAINAPGSVTYGQLTINVPWQDVSGGAIVQTFHSGANIYRRYSINTTTWGDWQTIADGATVGAIWGTNLYNIPTTLGAPAGSGLFLDSTHMGYYTAGAWKTYIDNSGNFILGNPATGNGLSWNQGTGVLLVNGIGAFTSATSGRRFVIDPENQHVAYYSQYGDLNYCYFSEPNDEFVALQFKTGQMSGGSAPQWWSYLSSNEFHVTYGDLVQFKVTTGLGGGLEVFMQGLQQGNGTRVPLLINTTTWEVSW